MLLAPPETARAGLVLTEGQDLTREFRELPFVGSTVSNSYGVNVSFGADLLDVGEAIEVRAYEDTLDGGAFINLIFEGTGQPLVGIGTISGATSPPSDPWLDRQGWVRWTMISGTVEIESFAVSRAWNQLGLYTETYPVPEPQLGKLLLSALCASALVSRRRRSAR